MSDQTRTDCYLCLLLLSKTCISHDYLLVKEGRKFQCAVVITGFNPTSFLQRKHMFMR
jgi:hypothetical protein